MSKTIYRHPDSIEGDLQQKVDGVMIALGLVHEQLSKVRAENQMILKEIYVYRNLFLNAVYEGGHFTPRVKDMVACQKQLQELEQEAVLDLKQ